MSYLLVCGSRTFDDRDLLWATLDELAPLHLVTRVIEGDATGADRLAGEWATDRGLELCVYPAEWDRYGKAAGPLRNQQMLDEGKPDIVAAFLDKPLAESRGTANMVRRARGAGVEVLLFGYESS